MAIAPADKSAIANDTSNKLGGVLNFLLTNIDIITNKFEATTIIDMMK